MNSPVAALRALQNIITTSIDQIEESCKSRGLDFPSLDEPFTGENDAARADPVVQEASTLLAAAAHQLVATVQQPQKTIFTATVWVCLQLLSPEAIM